MPVDANSSAQSDWSTAGAGSRQKRVMPSRSRRGGPGLGHCEVDNLILETQKPENEPLIPADTPFLLTTNPKYAEEALNDSESGIQINVVANDRYFDRPDVLKAFREQAVIQTPEYEAISESISGVGGRFRPRNQEEVVAETSDAAYEKRHRKFENFEKRQRLREKEKLKHEHYKLKERIEQLRAMDGSTFMSLPSSAFTPPPRDVAEEATNSPYVSLNVGVSLVEGERRRKEMLDVAIMLEKRYSYLLPPRKIPEASSSTLKDTESREGEETDTERDPGILKKDKVPKLRTQSVKSSASSTPGHSPASLRPLVTRSWSTLIPEPKRPSKNHRASISTPAETPEPTLPVEEKEEAFSSLIVVESNGLASQPLPLSPQYVRNEKSPSPVIVVDDIPKTDRLPSQPPSTPTPVPSVRDEKSPSPHIVVDDIPEDDRLPHPPPLLTPSRHTKSPSPHIIMVDDVPESDKLPSQSPPPMPLQLVSSDVGTPNINSPEPPVENRVPLTIQDDMQLAEDLLMEISDEGLVVDTIIDNVSQPQLEPSMQHMENLDGDEEVPPTTENGQEPTLEREGRLPGKSVDPEEVEARTAAGTTEPVSTGELEQPRKRRRKWGSRNALLPRKKTAVKPSQRGILQQGIAGPSRVVEDEPEVVSGIRLEEIPTEMRMRDPLSARPAKRHRGSGEVILEPESISAAPTVDFDSGISATSLFLRGKTHVLYEDSRTKEKFCTPSLLMVACMRAMEKTKYRRTRETISFGVPTPDFGKGAIVDYELLEEILYRDYRDESPDPSGSSVESREEEADSSDEDEDAEGGQTDEETDEVSEDPDETEEEAEPVNRQSPEVQLSNERFKRIENVTHSPKTPLGPVVPQSGREKNHHGIKSTEQGHYSRHGNRFLVYQGPSDEQLVASPEAEPLPELPPGVRPREPSRRQHCDWDDELIWGSE